MSIMYHQINSIIIIFIITSVATRYRSQCVFSRRILVENVPDYYSG